MADVAVSLKPLLDIIASGTQEDWTGRNKSAFEALFGAPDGRYSKRASETVKLRAPGIKSDDGVPFAAYIHPSNPDSGPYGGASFVIFPVPDEPCLVAMVTGTQGLSPDETILGRPGHARKMQAICRWLNHKHGNGTPIAWAKQDPTRTDQSVPENVSKPWAAYQRVFGRYGKELYAVFRPSQDSTATTDAVAAMLDVMFDERGERPLKQFEDDAERIKAEWFQHLMPSTSTDEVLALLNQRRYVILQGPPGTGKTRMARQLIRGAYAGFGRTVQFHPNTTYENFIGGLAPVHNGNGLGFQFAPSPGILERFQI